MDATIISSIDNYHVTMNMSHAVKSGGADGVIKLTGNIGIAQVVHLAHAEIKRNIQAKLRTNNVFSGHVNDTTSEKPYEITFDTFYKDVATRINIDDLPPETLMSKAIDNCKNIDDLYKIEERIAAAKRQYEELQKKAKSK